MYTNPFVSVIIPNYNHGQFLYERITGILKQTYDNFEVIILDDNSSDNSRYIIEDFRNEIKVSHIVYNTTNSGSPFVQWDKGFQFAKGELIWIAESDDNCEPTFLKQIVNEFIKHKEECVISFCRSIYIDINNNHIGEEGLKGSLYINGKEFIKKYLSRYNYICNASGTVFRKSALNNIDRTYTHFRAGGDWLFWIEISKKGYISYIDIPLNFYRQHNANTTSLQMRTGNSEKENQSIFLHMKEKGDINNWQLFRTKVIHIYKLKYGKLKGYLTQETEKDIIKKWSPSLVVNITIRFLYVLSKIGIRVINW